jgi:Ca2+-binding RTX toxin-like protein
MVGDRVPLTVATSGCGASDYVVDCQVGSAGVRIDLGDGADLFSTNFDMPASVPVEVHGGAGNDTLTGGDERDVLDGGDGNDTVDGAGGSDVVQGGAGDDTVMGDHFEDANPDVVDGGPGTDTLQDDWTSRFTDLHPDVSLTLAGGADDGRPGEGDDVHGVERVIVNEGGSLAGTDGPEHLEAYQVLDSVRISGGGGDDELIGAGGADTIDGGAGNDYIDAGFGDDTINPGPGHDTVYADRRGGDCGPLWCTEPYGNDTIDLRDGEPDSVDCGFGQDTVYADPVDTVSPNCETVIRSGPGSGGSGGSGSSGSSGSAGPTKGGKPGARKPARCVVPRVTGLRVGVARKRLTAAGCRSRTIGHGRVVHRQSVRHGKVVPRGTRVTLRT